MEFGGGGGGIRTASLEVRELGESGPGEERTRNFSRASKEPRQRPIGVPSAQLLSKHESTERAAQLKVQNTPLQAHTTHATSAVPHRPLI